jgi:hypothetical protein
LEYLAEYLSSGQGADIAIDCFGSGQAAAATGENGGANDARDPRGTMMKHGRRLQTDGGMAGWMVAVLLASGAALFTPGALAQTEARQAGGRLGFQAIEHYAHLALQCIRQEYPNKISHVMQSDADVAPPRQLYPAFHGCFDWHSAVHGHWLLVRLLRLYPQGSYVTEARQALSENLQSEKLHAEAAYLRGEGRSTFERPYGLAWLLQLCAELHEWSDPEAQRWRQALVPLEEEAAARLLAWLPKLRYPIRTGEHEQTAFSLGLVLDWARIVDNTEVAALVQQKARAFHVEDMGCNLSFEPSGQDFLSPCLAEADLMRRVLPRQEFAQWLSGFLPQIPRDGSTAWLPVAEVTDRSDGKLAHLDGLNLSRAWMLDGIAAWLPAEDSRRPAIEAAAQVHRDAGLAAVTGKFYEGGHWLGSFAVYLVTQRGLGVR